MLAARIDDGACGWFIGTVIASGVGKAMKKQVPTATHVIEYKKKETGTKARRQGGEQAFPRQLWRPGVVAAAGAGASMRLEH